MTRSALMDGLVTEQTIRDALTFGKGDLFLAAAYLNCTAREVDSYIRASEEMQGFVAAIAKVKLDPEYAKMSREQFEDQLELLTRDYKLDALNVIHDMAMMGFDSAAMAEVKLKAAIALKGSGNDTVRNDGQSSILAELNQIYQTTAPRIKSVRVSQIEFEQGEQVVHVESGI